MSRTLTGIRPSLWARCVTAAVYQGRGETEAEHEPEVAEYLFRGQVFEEIVVRQIIAKHGADNVERQVVIPIPGIGHGHADAYIRSEKALIEVKSTVAAHPNSDIFQHGVNQLRLYIAHHPEAERGYLYMLNPNRMTPADIYTVNVNTLDLADIEQERAYIELATSDRTTGLAKHGDPWRPCTRPSQARGRMCPFAHVCFADWEPDPEQQITSPAALEAAATLKAIQDEKRQHAQAIKALEEGEKQAQAELAEHVEPGEAIVGPYAVRRTHVVRQSTFQPKAYEAAGFSLEPLAEFMKPGSEYDRWTITRCGTAGETEFEFGDEAPW